MIPAVVLYSGASGTQNLNLTPKKSREKKKTNSVFVSEFVFFICGGLFARQLEHASLPGSALINCGLFSPDVRVWFGSGFGWKTNGDHYGKGTRTVAVAVFQGVV